MQRLGVLVRIAPAMWMACGPSLPSAPPAPTVESMPVVDATSARVVDPPVDDGTEPAGGETARPTVDPAALAAFERLDPVCKGSALDLVAVLDDERCGLGDGERGRFDGGKVLKLSLQASPPTVAQRGSVNLILTLKNPTETLVVLDLDLACGRWPLEPQVADSNGERIDLVDDGAAVAMLCASQWRRLGLTAGGTATVTLAFQAVRRREVFVRTGRTVTSPGGAVGFEETREIRVVGPLPTGDHIVKVALPEIPGNARAEAVTRLRVVP